MSRPAGPEGAPSHPNPDQNPRSSAPSGSRGRPDASPQARSGLRPAARPADSVRPTGSVSRAKPAGPTAAEPADGHLRAILTSHPSAVVLVDGKGRIVYVNARTTELTGYRPEELLGRSMDVLVPEGDRPSHAADRATYLADPEPRPMGTGRDLSIRRSDGVEVPVEIGLSSFESDGQTYVVAVVADITARKKSEEALANTMSNLQELVEASPLATMMLDLDGRIVLWSPAATKLFGWRADEVLGRVLPHVPGSELPEVREILRRVGRGEVIAGMELRRQNKEGRPIQAELYAAPQRDASGHIIGVIEQMADITTRRQVEEALLQTQKM